MFNVGEKIRVKDISKYHGTWENRDKCERRNGGMGTIVSGPVHSNETASIWYRVKFEDGDVWYYEITELDHIEQEEGGGGNG